MTGCHPTTIIAILLVVTAVAHVCSGQNYLNYGNECKVEDKQNLCDSNAGLSCLNGICNCTLTTMEYFNDKDVCLSHVGGDCYLDGTANCIDNAVCVENVFDGNSQCACDTNFSGVAAPSCDKTALADPNKYSVMCCPTK